MIWIDYKSGSAVQSAGTISGMYGIAVAIPAVLYMAIGAVLRFMYPISRKVLAELQVQKEAIRGKI